MTPRGSDEPRRRSPAARLGRAADRPGGRVRLLRHPGDQGPARGRHRHRPRQPEYRHDPDQRRAGRQGLLRRDHAGQSSSGSSSGSSAMASCWASADRPRSTAASRWRSAGPSSGWASRCWARRSRPFGTPRTASCSSAGWRRSGPRSPGAPRADTPEQARKAVNEIGLPVMLRGASRSAAAAARW